MCGIAGMIMRRGPAARHELEAMLGRIRYRGPDAIGSYVRENAALGAVRLSIVDIAGGAQPAVSRDRNVAIVFNGEIFNFMDIRADLERRGVRFSSRSEIETLLELYLLEGRRMVERLKGQFAIAVWDARDKSLLLARDRLGIRPLFWCADDRGLAFASEIKALAERANASLAIDPRSLVQTFRFWTMVGDASPFENVHQVPAGHYLVYENDTAELVRFWQWPLPGDVAPLRLASDDEYVEAFAAEFESSVRRQAMADVKVASFLSGGIDSSAVAATFQRQLGNERLKTYSLTFANAEYDERDAQQLMVDHAGFDHASVHIGADDIADVFPKVVWHAEAPLYRTAAAPLYLLAEKVHADGIKVVQTGEGADEVLLGYDLFREAQIRRFWSRQPNSECRGRLLTRLYEFLPQMRDPRSAKLLLEFYRRTLSDPDDPHFAMALRWSAGRALEPYFSADLREFASGYNPVAELERWLPDGYGAADDVARAQSVEVVSLLGNYLLSSQGDRMTMAHSVEGRYPYLDDDFVAFVARLPRRQTLRGLRDKYVLRAAARDLLPAAIRTRPKFAFHAPDIMSFVRNGHLPGYVDEILSPASILDAGLFDPAQVQRLRKKAISVGATRADHRDNMAFVLILSTMLVHEFFVKRRPTNLGQIRESIPLRA